MMTLSVRSTSAILLLASCALNLGGVFLWNAANTFKLFAETPNDVYRPWLHHVAPLMIGIALLARR